MGEELGLGRGFGERLYRDGFLYSRIFSFVLGVGRCLLGKRRWKRSQLTAIWPVTWGGVWGSPPRKFSKVRFSKAASDGF